MACWCCAVPSCCIDVGVKGAGVTKLLWVATSFSPRGVKLLAELLLGSSSWHGDGDVLPVWLKDGGMAAQGRGTAMPGRCCAGRVGTVL